MNTLKKALGILWMLFGPLTILFLFYTAFKNINSAVKGDISNPVPWIIGATAAAIVVAGLVAWAILSDDD